MIPTGAKLSPARELGSLLDNRNACRDHCPTLVQKRNAAGCKTRGDDQVDTVRLAAVGQSRRGDTQELRVHYVQKIARSKTVGGNQDVGLAPADGLPAQH